MTVTVTVANSVPAGSLGAAFSSFSASGLFTLTGVEDTLTAHAGGTKAAALALSATKNFHRVSVCATEGDSVLLPAATVGQSHFVRNDGAAPMKVYGAGTDTINDIATATGVQQSENSGALYECLTAGEWRTTGLIEKGSWTPVVSSTVGAITTVGAVAGRYEKMGKLVSLFFNITITDNGTGAGAVKIEGMPFNLSATFAASVGMVRENVTSGLMCQAKGDSATLFTVLTYVNTYPCVSGSQLVGTLIYESA